MKWLGNLILRLGGWTLSKDYEQQMNNAIIIEAPHTTMWDFVIGRAGLWSLGIKSHFLIKKEMFFFPLGLLLKSLGGVPVDRGKDKKNFFEDVVKTLQEKKDFSLVVTPEGTRHYTNHWKKGFYFIASLSNKPIYMAWINYETKCCGIHKEKIIPSGDYNKDLAIIENFYKDVRAKYPLNFNLSKEHQKEK